MAAQKHPACMHKTAWPTSGNQHRLHVTPLAPKGPALPGPAGDCQRRPHAHVRFAVTTPRAGWLDGFDASYSAAMATRSRAHRATANSHAHREPGRETQSDARDNRKGLELRALQSPPRGLVVPPCLACDLEEVTWPIRLTRHQLMT